LYIAQSLSHFINSRTILAPFIFDQPAADASFFAQKWLFRQQFMSEIKVEVWDATGNKRQLVEVPADAEVNRLIAVLIDRMNLPRNSPDGQLMSYKFHHKASGRQLLDTETLAAASVKDGDILRLQPEITAGGARSLYA
jgi:hypothetical protein